MSDGASPMNTWHLAWRVAFGGFLLLALGVGLWLSLSPGIGGTSAQDVLDQRRAEGEAPAATEPAQEATEVGEPTRAERQEARRQRRERNQQIIAAAPDPEETSVQVLDGAGDTAAVEAAIDSLNEHGYDIVATNPSRQDYDVTTVLYTEGHEAEAEALRARDGRFGEIELNDRLSESVDLHVIVGTDLSD
jgi:predicted methyltransferase